MNIEELRSFCLSLKGTYEKMPFGDRTLVFTVKDKIFCLTDITAFEFINLKCDPDKAVVLREEYQEVTPGYHMNKKHWNSVKVIGTLSNKLMEKWIVDSYNLVVAGLPKKTQKELSNE